MKIGINLADVTPGKNGGMEGYARSLVEYMQKLDVESEFYLVGKREVINSFYLGENGYRIPIETYLFHNTDLHKVLHTIIDTYQFDAWFCPMLALNPLDCPIPSAICIPDLQHRYYPEFFDRNTTEWRETYMRQSGLRADIVFTLSNNSKKDLVKLYHLDPKKVVPVYLDAPREVKEAAMTKVKRPLVKGDYLFYPANAWPHKNHLNLIKALAKVRDRYPSLSLVLTGTKEGSSQNISNLIRELKLSRSVKILGYVDQNIVINLYQHAKGLVFPSLFEGFGIPIIEAFNLGCPVLCMDNTSIKEIAGQAVMYFNGESVEMMASSIEKFVSNNKLRNKLVKAGYKQARKFKYELTAQKTLHKLESITHKKRYPRKNLISHDQLPMISIITPSFNQKIFIEQTIISVQRQKYPKYEHIIVDGGSTDGTISILKRYDKTIKWVSEPDKGQADAINKGMRMAKGEILAYINSDDTYEDGALLAVGEYFYQNPRVKFVYGKGKYIDKNGRYLEDYPNAVVDKRTLFYECNVCQPTSFWRRDLWEQVGEFDPSRQMVMDYEYWMRVQKIYKMKFLNSYLANYRLHTDSKTVSKRKYVYKEAIAVSARHYKRVSYNWIVGYMYVSILDDLEKMGMGKRWWSVGVAMIWSSLLYLWYNQEVPERRVLKIYLSWIKQELSHLKQKLKHCLVQYGLRSK